MADTPTLVLFPGLGATARIFAPQRTLPAHLEILDWIEPESPQESFAHYVQRMAAGIIPRPDLYLGGVSMGAMAALESSLHIAARGIFLIGGCYTHRQIAPLFRAALRIGSMLPVRSIHPMASIAPPILNILEKLNPPNRALVTEMLQEVSPSQIRWSCRAVIGWEYPASLLANACMIHGQFDHVIPIANVRPDHVIPKGRHFISLTHPAEVNQIIANVIGAKST